VSSLPKPQQLIANKKKIVEQNNFKLEKFNKVESKIKPLLKERIQAA